MQKNKIFTYVSEIRFNSSLRFALNAVRMMIGNRNVNYVKTVLTYLTVNCWR